MEELICDYCKINKAVGVYAADHGPFSLSECEECLKHKNLRTIGNGISKWIRFGDKAFDEYADPEWNGNEPKIFINGKYRFLRDVVNNLTIGDIKYISKILSSQFKELFFDKIYK